MNNRSIADRAVAAFNRHDAEAIGSIYAPDASQADPQYETPLRGRDAIKQDFQQLFTSFPDVKLELVNVLTDDHAVAYEVIMRGTHAGPLPTPQGEVPATNRRIEVRACHFMRTGNDGLVVEDHRYYDLAGFMAQLGLMGE